MLDALVTASGGTPWTFDSSTTTADNNKLAAWVLFTSTMVYQVGTSSFTDTGYINDDTSAPATINVGDTTAFEDGVTDMDTLPVGAARHAWFKFRMPGTTDNANQRIKYTFTAQAANWPRA